MFSACDSASRANINFCTGRGVRVAGGSPRLVLMQPLVDDGGAPGDAPCDGVFTRAAGTGGLFGRGLWEFRFDCTDRQGNVGSGPECTLLIGGDSDGDGLQDSVDPCPLDVENDQDGDGVCESTDNCPTVPNNGAGSDDYSGGAAVDHCADPGWPDCVLLEAIGGPPAPLATCVDRGFSALSPGFTGGQDCNLIGAGPSPGIIEYDNPDCLNTGSSW